MKRSLSFLALFFFVTMFSGCIISMTPNTSTVTILRGNQQEFKVVILPPGASYVWTLDGENQTNGTSSYQYTPTGGIHKLVVNATHIFGTDTQTWNITCPEASAPIGSAGGTVAVTETNSPLYGAEAIIPAGALASTVTITITQVTAPAVLPGQPAGPCVDFGPDGTQFSTPVELSLSYADDDNDGIVDGTGVSEDQVKAYYYNSTSSSWEEASVTGRDNILNLVRISVTHFSEYTTGVPIDTPLSIAFQNMYGGSGNDAAGSIQQTSDGGYILGGLSSSTDIPGTTFHGGQADYYIIKLDAAGGVVWQKLYGGSGDDLNISIQQTNDGGYILAGFSSSNDIPGVVNHGSSDFYIIRLNASGEAIWQKMYGGSGLEIALSIQPTSDGGFIIAGYSTSTDIPGITTIYGQINAYIIKIDSSGEVQWQQMYGDMRASSIQQTNTGGYIVIGWGGANDQYDHHILNLDMDGNIIWDGTYGGSGIEKSSTILQTGDGGFIASGISNSTDISNVSSHGGYDAYVIKLDNLGGIQWQQMIGGAENEGAYESIAGGECTINLTSDGGYVLATCSDSTDIPGVTNHGLSDFYIVKMDADGNVLWQNMYGGSDVDGAESMLQTSDGGYAIAGLSYSTDISGVTNHGNADVYFIKLNPESSN